VTILTAEQLARREALLVLDNNTDLPMSTAQHAELALLDKLYAIYERREQEGTKHAELMRVGKCAADSLREMVAALECDYDRLEELRESRDEHDEDQSAYTQLGAWNAVYPSLAKDLAELELAAGECTSRDDAEQRIQEDALSIECRGDWYVPLGDGDTGVPVEFRILLSTGGPATRIMGELRDGEPHRAWLEVQDWGTPWTQYREEGLDDVLLSYSRCFYFGQ